VLRKLAISVAAFLLLGGTVAVVWSALNLVPIRFLWRYGLTPGCEPTGKVIPAEGVEFVVIGPGVCRIGSDALLDRTGDDWLSRRGRTEGDVAGRLCGLIGVSWGRPPKPSDEMPVHWCEFPEGFALAKTEVTNAQYERFDPKHERSESSKDDTDPVVNVSWEDAKAYCAWLGKQSGRAVRLPTESEWEAACRAGSRSEYCFGDDEGRLGEYAWYGESWQSGAREVGTKKPNAWGFYDLHGNVWEWCEDLWHGSYRLTETVPDPDGRPQLRLLSRAPTDGTAWLFDAGSPYRVRRGGSWPFDPQFCRSSYRFGDDPGSRWNNLGFRPALGH
jgi:formylglycine-generating enzyme required for sulfatase activity